MKIDNYQGIVVNSSFSEISINDEDIDDLDLVSHFEYEEDPRISNFITGLNGVSKLWRLTDEGEPNCFKLRLLSNGKLEESVSLMEVLEELYRSNSGKNEYLIFFVYMIKKVKNLNILNNREEILNHSCLILDLEKISSLARANKDFLDKIDCIKISKNQRRTPYVHHWDLKYTESSFDSDENLIDLLMSCTTKSTYEVSNQNIEEIFHEEFICC